MIDRLLALLGTPEGLVFMSLAITTLALVLI